MVDGVDEDGRRRRRLPPENKRCDVRSTASTVFFRRAANGSATRSGGLKHTNSDTDRDVKMESRRVDHKETTEVGDIRVCWGKGDHFLGRFLVFVHSSYHMKSMKMKIKMTLEW
jgi:hypothetical protein